MADKVDFFLNAIFDIRMRKNWDTKLTDHFQIGFIQNKNMILIEEESEQLVAGYDEREWIYKRFFWRDGGFFYVY